jgi:hypothetical protein
VAQELASLHHLLLRIGNEALKKAFTWRPEGRCAANIAAKLLRYN